MQNENMQIDEHSRRDLHPGEVFTRLLPSIIMMMGFYINCIVNAMITMVTPSDPLLDSRQSLNTSQVIIIYIYYIYIYIYIDRASKVGILLELVGTMLELFIVP